MNEKQIIVGSTKEVYSPMPVPIRKAVFPVGGYGTRFLPATKAVPKEMLPLLDKPLIQYAVEEALNAGIESFVFVTGRGKSTLEDHFERSLELEAFLQEKEKAELLDLVQTLSLKPGQMAYVRQQHPLGLGHAVLCARALVGQEPFAVLLPDEVMVNPKKPCLKQLMDLYQHEGNQVLAVVEVPKDKTHRYGILDPQAVDGRIISLKGIMEKPDPDQAPSTWAVVGRYILHPEIFDWLDIQSLGIGGEIQLTDAISASLSAHPTCGLAIEGKRFDCGNQAGMLEATLRCALEHPDLKATTQALLRQLAKEEGIC